MTNTAKVKLRETFSHHALISKMVAPEGESLVTAAREDVLSGRRILVTGGSGFIGSRVAELAAGAGAQVMSVDRELPAAGETRRQRVELCDIRSDDMAGVVADFAPHVVVHLAAQVGVAEAALDPSRDADVNVRGTIAVAEAAVAAGTELLVFAGSCAVYGPVATLPVGEEHQLAPMTPYGLSKAAALCYLEWFARDRGLPVTSLILGNVYGPGQRAEKGGVINRFVSDAVVGRASQLNGDGGATRDFVHVDDVADAMLTACSAPAAGRVNIGSGVETSITAVRTLVRESTSTDIPVRYRVARVGDIKRMCLRIDRAGTALGWSPQISLRDGIASLAATTIGATA